jgi:plasmid stabilization system protein ParE
LSAYTLHPEAFDDLDEIRAYITEDNPDAADRIVTEVFDTIRGLVQSPHQGYCRPNLTSRSIRFALVREYLIAYMPDSVPLRVLGYSTGGVALA